MGIDLANIDFRQVLLYLFVVVWSITIHEFAHAFAADRLGDDTPRRQGRISLYPQDHFDPLGFMMIVFMALGGRGLGWGKPVQINPAVLRHPRRDDILITAAGPFSNLCLAVISGLLIRFLPVHLLGGLTGELLQAFLWTNLSLMFFNLIPIPPLDGSRILSNLLPYELAVRYDRTLGVYGPMLLILLVFVGGSLVWSLIGPPSLATADFITGMRWG